MNAYVELLEQTVRYIRENHSLDERIFFATPLPVPVPVRKPVPPPPPTLAPLPPPPAPEKKVEPPRPEPSPQPVPVKSEAPAVDNSALRRAMEELAPQLLTNAPVPDDSVAEKKRVAWKEKKLAAEVTLLSFEGHGRGHLFLENLARAISNRLVPARVAVASLLEGDNRWNTFLESSTLKQLIAFPIPFAAYPHLRVHFKENGQSGAQFIGSKPLLTLRPLQDYLETPSLKKELWDLLCTHLSS